nr:glycosyltransferase [Motilibacter aurantiacus]
MGTGTAAASEPGTEPLVSVLIATRNPDPQLLELALAGVRAQTYPRWEVVLVDDGSDVPVTVPLDPRVTVLRVPEGRGVSAARNLAAYTSRGEVLAFLDDDDMWEPTKLERQVAALADEDVVLADTVCDIVDQDGALRGPGYPDWWRDRYELLQGCGIITSSVCVPRWAFFLAGGFDAALAVAEDWDLFLRLSELGRIARVEPVLTHYRVVGDPGRRYRDTAAVAFAMLEKQRVRARAQRDDAAIAAIAQGHARLRRLFAEQAFSMARTTLPEDWAGAAAHLARSIRLSPWPVLKDAAHFRPLRSSLRQTRRAKQASRAGTEGLG